MATELTRVLRTYTLAHSSAPALILFDPAQKPKGVILCYHGVLAYKEDLEPDYRAFASAGFYVVSIDAPYHGERKDARYQKAITDSWKGIETPGLPRPGARNIEEAVAEIPELITQIQTEIKAPVGIYGFSMGGMIVFSALLNEPRIQAAVTLNSTPKLKDSALAAFDHPEKFGRCPLFVVNSTLDTSTFTASAREFLPKVRPFFAENTDSLAYHEFAQSPHALIEPDWVEFRRLANTGFERWLAAESAK